MTVGTVYSRYAAEFQQDGEGPGAATLIGAITEQRINTATEVRTERTDGEAFSRFIALYAQRPLVQLTTMAIAQALGYISPTFGKRIVGTTELGANFYAQKWSEGGGPDAGNVHTKHNLKEGLIVPRSLSCSHQGDAELQIDVIITYDGTNEPVVKTINQALPTGLVNEERFTLGKFSVPGLVAGQITQLDIDFGLLAQSIGADSDIWDTFARTRGVNPTVRIRGTDLDWFAGATGVPLIGKKLEHADTNFFLRKRLDASTFVADNVAEHIRFTTAGMATIDTIQEETGDEPSECVMDLTSRFDGTNAPLIVNTASVIT